MGFMDRFKWPIRVVVYQIRSGNIYVIMDKARRKFNDRGESVYMLKKLKVSTKPMKYDDIQMTKGGKNFLTVMSSSHEEYTPIRTKTLLDDNKLVSMDENLKVWLAGQYKRRHEMWITKMGMLMKFLPVALIGVTVMGVMLILYVTFQGMTDLAGSLGGIAGGIQSAADKLTLAYQVCSGVPPTTITPPPF